MFFLTLSDFRAIVDARDLVRFKLKLKNSNLTVFLRSLLTGASERIEEIWRLQLKFKIFAAKV